MANQRPPPLKTKEIQSVVGVPGRRLVAAIVRRLGFTGRDPQDAGPPVCRPIGITIVRVVAIQKNDVGVSSLSVVIVDRESSDRVHHVFKHVIACANETAGGRLKVVGYDLVVCDVAASAMASSSALPEPVGVRLRCHECRDKTRNGDGCRDSPP